MAAPPFKRQRTRHHQEPKSVLGQFGCEALLILLDNLCDCQSEVGAACIGYLNCIGVDNLIINLDRLATRFRREPDLFRVQIVFDSSGRVGRECDSPLKTLGFLPSVFLILAVFILVLVIAVVVIAPVGIGKPLVDLLQIFRLVEKSLEVDTGICIPSCLVLDSIAEINPRDNRAQGSY